MSDRILTCLADVSDLTGLVRNIGISGPSIKFMVDNVRISQAAWSCQSSCFANNPTNDLSGIGEMEIRAETLRYVLCCSRDLLEDSAVSIEQWALGKVSWAFKNTISNAILTGDGVGKPLGILNPQSGYAICDTAATTPAGQMTWQDLLMLRYQLPLQFIDSGTYILNQRTMGLILTMSDGIGRPIMIADPTQGGRMVIGGRPVVIATQMPDVAPGSTPVAYGDWAEAYTLIVRKGTTLIQDPYSAGFCVLLKFEARYGGAPTCPLAACLLRIR
jgi:HK97 family phage major capsid protein